jgi:membrane-associated phospholipid phosphatase
VFVSSERAKQLTHIGLCAASFVALATVVRLGWVVGFDRNLFPAAGHHSCTALFLHVAWFFQMPQTVVIVILIAVAGWHRSAYSKWAVVAFPAGVLLMVSVELLCRAVLKQPAGSLPLTQDGLRLLWSFPSGHEARATYVVMLLSPLVLKRVRWLLWMLLVVFAYGLVVSGWHYPSDVLGGFILGLGTSLVVNLVSAHSSEKPALSQANA